MPQKTNLNVAPYYDDFAQDKNFYKVLFRPGYSIQARELTQLQSSLQNQIESFGKYAFKQGELVIPGDLLCSRWVGIEEEKDERVDGWVGDNGETQ